MKWPWLALALVACSSTETEDPTGGGGVLWTTSAGGTGGSVSSTGGAGATGGEGGTGGETATGGSGQGGGGGAAAAAALILATGSSGHLEGVFDGASWTVATGSASSSVAPALSLVGSTGLGVIAVGANGSLPIHFTTFDGAFSAFSDSGAVTRAAPSLAAGSLVHHAPDFKHAFSLYAGGWNPVGEPIAPPSEPQSFGPTPPRATRLGGDTVVAFAGGDTQLYVQVRSGTWGAATPIAGALVEEPPALVALTGGPELLAVWVHHEPASLDHTKLFFSTRTGGSWSTPTKISEQVFTSEAPSLAPLAGGDALLAFRGSDGKGYTLRYSGGSFGAVIPLEEDVMTTPAVSAGASGADAELAFVAPGGTVAHMRLSGTSFSAPLPVGGSGLSHAAVLALP